ncbi:MAG: hypothetical protein ACKO1R_05720 [Crocinitomicaceae bacterium]
MVRILILFTVGLFLLASCSKEVQIDIPQFKEKVVVEGRLFAGEFPVVLLSLTQNIYAPTDISNYLASFISDAQVYMVVDGDSVVLNPVPLNQLEMEALAHVSEILEIEPEEAALLPIVAYTTIQPTFKGAIGKTHRLTISYKGSYSYAETTLLNPISLTNLVWQPEVSNSAYGRLNAGFQDPIANYDAYYWEVKRIHQFNGEVIDKSYERPSGGYIRDKYWNGTFRNLNYGNPLKRKDTTHLEEYRRYFREGDQVVVRFSKMEYEVYEFFRTRREQIENQGSPFASPLNVKSNLVGNAVGIWAGFSPSYDTIVCQP